MKRSRQRKLGPPRSVLRGGGGWGSGGGGWPLCNSSMDGLGSLCQTSLHLPPRKQTQLLKKKKGTRAIWNSLFFPSHHLVWDLSTGWQLRGLRSQHDLRATGQAAPRRGAGCVPCTPLPPQALSGRLWTHTRSHGVCREAHFFQ